MTQIITRPSAANRNFPYHVRTSQIGVITEPSGNVSNNVDGFTHHAYGTNVLGEPTTPNFTEMFAVSSFTTGPSNGFMGNNNSAVSFPCSQSLPFANHFSRIFKV